METMLLKYQPLVMCNSRTALKNTYHVTEITNEWKWGQETVSYIVRFIFQLSYELHVQISDIFTMSSCAV